MISHARNGEAHKSWRNRVRRHQVGNFGLLAEEPKCREPHKGDLLYPRRCSTSFREIPKGQTPNLQQTGHPDTTNCTGRELDPAGGELEVVPQAKVRRAAVDVVAPVAEPDVA